MNREQTVKAERNILDVEEEISINDGSIVVVFSSKDELENFEAHSGLVEDFGDSVDYADLYYDPNEFEEDWGSPCDTWWDECI